MKNNYIVPIHLQLLQLPISNYNIKQIAWKIQCDPCASWNSVTRINNSAKLLHIEGRVFCLNSMVNKSEKIWQQEKTCNQFQIPRRYYSWEWASVKASTRKFIFWWISYQKSWKQDCIAIERMAELAWALNPSVSSIITSSPSLLLWSN